jgi:hypothetical protein
MLLKKKRSLVVAEHAYSIRSGYQILPTTSQQAIH